MFADIKETYYGIKSAQYAAISQITHQVIVEGHGTPNFARLELEVEKYDSYRKPYVYLENPEPMKEVVNSLKVVDGSLIAETESGDRHIGEDDPDILSAQTFESIAWFLYNREFRNNER